MHLFRRGKHEQPQPSPGEVDVNAVDEMDPAALPAFACTTCGRTDLPEAGDWDPPICQECDAAINFDAITMEADDLD
jgi:hypothetical protein